MQDVASLITRYFVGIHELRIYGLINKPLATMALNEKVFKALLLRNLCSLLSSFFIIPYGLNLMLSSTKSVIAGSFVLQCITGVDYSRPNRTTDIDVYVPSTKLGEWFTFMADSGYEKDPIPRRPEHDYRHEDLIFAVHPFRHIVSRRTIEIMSMDPLHPSYELVQRFDFSFLRNWYDGSRFHLSHPSHVIAKKGSYHSVRKWVS
jgi:hypothetical protein